MSDKFYYSVLTDNNSKTKGDENGYKVFAQINLEPGDRIEECVVVDMNLGLVSGNYVCYNRSDDYNAVYLYDDAFSILTIRATKSINRGDEIILPTKKKTIEKKGCNCGKSNLRSEFKPSTQGPPKILKEKDVFAPNEKTNSQFKSMVDGKDLKTIQVDS